MSRRDAPSGSQPYLSARNALALTVSRAVLKDEGILVAEGNTGSGGAVFCISRAMCTILRRVEAEEFWLPEGFPLGGFRTLGGFRLLGGFWLLKGCRLLEGFRPLKLKGIRPNRGWEITDSLIKLSESRQHQQKTTHILELEVESLSGPKETA